jgi:predicted dinucleotide-binding enzyme
MTDTIGIVGAGRMGTGIAQISAQAGLNVVLGAGLENGRDFGLVVGRGKGLVSGLGGLIA